MSEVINWFLEDIINAMQWRSRKAEEYPEDSRNENSAHALAHLYDYVAKASDDVVITKLSLALESIQGDDGAIFRYVEEVPFFLGRFGFFESIDMRDESLDSECREFLNEITTIISDIRVRSNEAQRIS
jgi:hypothetical protein